jgi:ribonuclease R
VRGVIRSVERMTYTNVHLLLEGDEGLRRNATPLVERFELMRELALILYRRRMRRGSIDFDLPEPLIEFDEWGEMTGIARPRATSRTASSRSSCWRPMRPWRRIWNSASGDASIACTKSPIPAVLEFEQIAARFGYSLDIGPAGRGASRKWFARATAGRSARTFGWRAKG